jgi:colanic acid biosynthesis glycosyl transferase WcaI
LRILLVQRHFWPDVVTTAPMARAIAERLTSDGHQVTVLSSMPSYNDAYSGPRPPRRETSDGYRVIRMRLPRERKRGLAGRAVDVVAFVSRSAFHVLLHGRRCDLITVSTAPPVFLAAAVRVVSRLVRRPYLYHCEDLNPEVALLSGVLHEGGRTRLLGHLDRVTAGRAAAVVVLSSDMVMTLRLRGLDCQNVTVINNFLVTFEAEGVGTLPVDLRKQDGLFRVLFAGNLGLVQGLQTVIEAARLLSSHSDIQFAFVGTGAAEDVLKCQAGEMLGGSVVFFPHQPLAVIMKMMEESDLGLVSLLQGVYRTAYPSKTMAYLEAGCPILAAVEPESELAAFIVANGVGATCAPGDAAGLASAVLNLKSAGFVAADERARIREVGRRNFGANQALDRWSALFAGLNPRRM